MNRLFLLLIERRLIGSLRPPADLYAVNYRKRDAPPSIKPPFTRGRGRIFFNIIDVKANSLIGQKTFGLITVRSPTGDVKINFMLHSFSMNLGFGHR